jgi:hypothetical protein
LLLAGCPLIFPRRIRRLFQDSAYSNTIVLLELVHENSSVVRGLGGLPTLRRWGAVCHRLQDQLHDHKMDKVSCINSDIFTFMKGHNST